MPLKWSYSISTKISRLVVRSRARKNPNTETIQRNMRRVLKDKTEDEITELSRLVYEGFGDYLIEFIKQGSFSNARMMERCKFKNTELLVSLFKDHKFIICYGGHMLNFEWLVSFPLHFPNYGMCHLYLAAEQNTALDWVLATRGRYGAINISAKSPIKTLLQLKHKMENNEIKEQGFVFGTLADMDTKDPNPHVSTFFDHDLEMKTGSERIGRKLNMAFVYAHILRPQRGYYEIEFQEMKPDDVDTNPYAYTDEFVRKLEHNISEQPELWMLWPETRF